MKRLLMLLCFLLLTPLGHAEGSLQEVWPQHRIVTFACTLPEALRQPLEDHGLGGATLICGAAIDRSGFADASPDEPSLLPCSTALLLMENDGGRFLVGMAQVGASPWQVLRFAPGLLRREDCAVRAVWPEGVSYPVYSVVYPTNNGEMSDLYRFSGNRLWELAGHWNAEGLRILRIGDAFAASTGSQVLHYSIGQSCYVEYTTDARSFPASLSALEAQEAAFRDRAEAFDTAEGVLLLGVNLRMEPTQNSPSLGLYEHGVPAVYLGQSEPGWSYPWLHVRIGSIEGWVSSNYTAPWRTLEHPLRMGRTADGCALYATPAATAPAQQLPPGATFHILARTAGGRLHVCIPRGEIAEEVDPQGLFGYVEESGLIIGWSPVGLDAQEGAQR